MEAVIENPFRGRTDGVKYEGQKFDKVDYAKCTIVQRVNRLSKSDDTAFDVITDIQINDIVPLQDYINQFAEDVGILNVLKKVVKTGDVGLINQCEPGYFDLTNMPEDFLEARKMYDAAMSAYDKLPDDLKNGLSAEQFANLTSDNLQKSLDDYIAKVTQPVKEEVKEVKEGDK